MAKIKVDKLLGRKWQERLRLKRRYDLDDLDDLLEDFFKGVWHWLRGWWRGRGQRRAAGGETAVAPRAGEQPAALRPAVQAYVDQALAYQAEIQRLARQAEGELARLRLQPILGRVGDWVTAVNDLAAWMAQFEGNALVRQDGKRVPKAVAELEKQLAAETDPLLREALARTLASRRQQQATLAQLEQRLRQAEIKIEHTVSMLGTLYSQLLVGQTTGQVADYRHLLHEVNEEVDALQDYLDALHEVRLGSL